MIIYFRIYTIIQFTTLLAEFRFYPELIIYGVYFLEVALKKVLPHTIHTTFIFLAFRRHTITCVQLANVPL